MKGSIHKLRKNNGAEFLEGTIQFVFCIWIAVAWVPLLQQLINKIINETIMWEVRFMYCYSLHKYTIFIPCHIFVNWDTECNIDL